MEIGSIQNTSYVSLNKTQNGKEIKPDKPTIQEHTNDTVSVNSKNIASYFPNINFSSSIFEQQLGNANKLADGSIILKPEVLGSTTDIQQNEDGTYTVTTTPSVLDAEPKTEVKTEKEILESNIWSGIAKPIGNGEYEVTYKFKDKETGEITPLTINLDAKGIENLMNIEYMCF